MEQKKRKRLGPRRGVKRREKLKKMFTYDEDSSSGSEMVESESEEDDDDAEGSESDHEIEDEPPAKKPRLDEAPSATERSNSAKSPALHIEAKRIEMAEKQL